jgi:dihydroxyacetone kinase-like predicted kinase
MLTVVREMGARMASDLAHMREARLPGDAAASEQNAVIAELVERALDAGRDSLARGPDLLPALRDAGVVDAGGYGLIVMLSGIVAALRGLAPAPLAQTRDAARVTHPQHSSTTYRYCTNFAVTGSGLEARRFISQLEDLGDAVLVVGDSTTLKVHVHTDSPKAATALFADAGTISHLDIADMQTPMRAADEPALRKSASEVCGLVAVAGGPGIRALFESFGAHVLDRPADASTLDGDGFHDGPPSSPSAYDLLAAVHAIDAEQVVLLPNAPELLAPAKRAAELSDKAVFVVESRSRQAGLAAAAVLDPGRGAAENAKLMAQTLERVTTGSVAPATADDASGRFHAGDAVGFVDDELVAWGQPREALRAVLERLADGAELITCLRGADAPLDDRTVETLAVGEVEFELSEGGQRGAWWLLAAE